jgi:hypothetical protein
MDYPKDHKETVQYGPVTPAGPPKLLECLRPQSRKSEPEEATLIIDGAEDADIP